MSDFEEVPSEHKPVVVKYGFPVMQSSFQRIKFFSTILSAALIVDVFLAIKLFISSIHIRSHLGYFINMIATGEGDVLPSLQAVPVFFFLLINAAMIYLLFQTFDKKERHTVNRFMYVTIILGAILIIIILILIIAVISHAYGVHESLHDGIVKVMHNYSVNTEYKRQMDHLQVEFQCCGSKKYDEWYEIKWYDSSLEGGRMSLDGNTPFSCCSMKSLFPCIHHDIEVTGKVYMYTPEENLSISTRGCYEMVRERKKEVGWSIVANLAIYLVLECLTVVLFRLIQTAHCEKGRFFGNAKEYTMWVFGCYSRRSSKRSTKKRTPAKKKKRRLLGRKKPKVPPLPDELKD